MRSDKSLEKPVEIEKVEKEKKRIEDPLNKLIESKHIGNEVVPPLKGEASIIPFPQRLKKGKTDRIFSKFLEIFKKLHINIPFLEALKQILKYMKFMKGILVNKKRLDEYETVVLTEECSAILQKKLPSKLKDPESFNISCTIGKSVIEGALM